jgi:acyl-CoA thioesterase FadM
MTTATRELLVPVGRPRYEGANIRTWVGFKHFMYLVEEALLAWFRDQGHPAGQVFHRYGLGLEVVDSSVLLPAVLDVDDEVQAEVSELRPGRFAVRLRVNRGDGADTVVLRGKVTVALVVERDAAPTEPVPAELAGLVVPEVADERQDLLVGPGEEVGAVLTAAGSSGFLWSWRIPYFYCHFSDRIQHSAYVRALEEVVDRFLADRDRSVGRMLAERAWIPVVSRARVRMLADAHMEEVVHTTFTVTDVFKATTYDARMDCYVRRGDRLVHTATARIMHGYANSRGESAGRLAELDPDTIAALTGVRP